MNTKRQSTKYLPCLHLQESVRATQDVTQIVTFKNPAFKTIFRHWRALRRYCKKFGCTVRGYSPSNAFINYPNVSNSLNSASSCKKFPPVSDLTVKNFDAVPPSIKAATSIPQIILSVSPICENLVNLWTKFLDPFSGSSFSGNVTFVSGQIVVGRVPPRGVWFLQAEHKMSHAIGGDNPFPLGKCHFPVTFLSFQNRTPRRPWIIY
ncbi:MAG: hypothetical protein JWM04_2428 [Verrucomicrobiales bacterium]|jgi:hypothetical protein|nr:hypothetical protein [Verrucomicrobiales bacterium]